MSTFLQLAQILRRKVGGTGTGPSAVTSQTGEDERYVEDIAEAYTEIQNRCHWRWLRHGFTVNTVADDDVYAYGDCTDTTTSSAITRFGSWRFRDRNDPPKIYLTSSGVGTQRWLIWVPWEDFKEIYRIGTQNSGSPVHVSIDPQDNIVIGPAPNDVYTITGDYIRSAQVLAADGDIPEMPTQFHMLVVYRAMEEYAGYEGSADDKMRSIKKGQRLMRQLERNQRPKMRLSGPMA